MDKRTILALVLCGAILVVWMALFPPAKPTPPGQGTRPAPTAAPNPTTPAATPSAAAPAPGGPAVNHPERQVVLETPSVRFVLSSLGGTLLHAELRDQQFLERKGDPTSGRDVVRTLEPKDAPFRTGFPSSGFPAPADGAWEVTSSTADSVVFAADVGTVHVEKRYHADSARFRLDLHVVVANRGAAPVSPHLTMAVTGRQDPDKRGGGFLSGPASNPSSILCDASEKVERTPIDKLVKDPFTKEGAIRWVASDEKFFILAAVPAPENPPRDRTCHGSSIGDGLGQVMLTFQERTVAPSTETDYPFTLFVGPKFKSDLDQVRFGDEAVGLDDAIDVTLAMISKPILSLLKFFHSFAHNWGLAIVLLTLFIKLVTFYPTQKSLLSAKKMQKLAPKLNAIRKKYENDRQRQSVETMNLYKAHGVSPFGGCLPSLIQMPIWIALYSTLNYSVELYRAPFIGHIHDLTAKDPFYITPLVMGGLMFLQMRMSPSGADSQQQAMMSVMMPIMFTGFSLFLPSGLAVYMLTSYLIGILQQLYINHLDKKGATR
jgi:YidC/Oxa1 family membrane protein insertase